MEPGILKERSAEELEQQEREHREREELDARAKQAAEKARRATLAGQENPPLDHWQVMPKYELAGRVHH